MNTFARKLLGQLLATAVALSVSLKARAGLVAQYFPMNNADSRFYQDHDTPENKSTEVFTSTTYNGHSAFSLNFHDEYNTTAFSSGTWYLGYSGNNLALYGIVTSWGSLSLGNAADILTDQLLTNDGGITNSTTGILLGSYAVDVTVKATVSSVSGTFAVPDGTFNNCKLLAVVATASISGTLLSYDSAAWVLAPGVGIIADGVATWDVNTGQFTFYDLFGNYEDYFELVSYTIQGPDRTPPSDTLSSWPTDGTQLYINPVFIWGTATDAGFGGSGIAQVTVNGIRASNDTAVGNGSAIWSLNVNLAFGTNQLTIVATDGAGNSTTNFLTLIEMIGPPIPVLQPITAKNGTVQLAWSTVSNHVYQVQYATNLVSPNWLNLGNNITATGSSLSSGDTIGSNKLRFYRVLMIQ